MPPRLNYLSLKELSILLELPIPKLKVVIQKYYQRQYCIKLKQPLQVLHVNDALVLLRCLQKYEWDMTFNDLHQTPPPFPLPVKTSHYAIFCKALGRTWWRQRAMVSMLLPRPRKRPLRPTTSSSASWPNGRSPKKRASGRNLQSVALSTSTNP